jgi:magnesium transporter
MPSNNHNAVDFIIDRVKQKAFDEISQFIEPLAHSDKARLIESLPKSYRATIWNEIATESKAETLLELHKEVRRGLIEITDEAELIRALSCMQMDELADIDDDLPLPVVSAMVETLNNQNRQRYNAVKVYPDDVAGGLMDVDATAVRPDISIKAVIRYLRQLRSRTGELPEHLESLFVVDRNNYFIGTVSLSDLISYPSHLSISQISKQNIPAIRSLDSADDVVKTFEANDLLSAPVVDESNKLIGRITVDDVIDYMRDQSEKELLKKEGLDQQADLFAPIIQGSMRRAVWLGINLLTAFSAAWIIGMFDASIEKLVALAVLMPVVASMGGVTGSQTLTIITRGIAVGKIARSNIASITRHELAIASLNAVLWSTVVFLISWGWYQDWELGLVFAMAMFIVIVSGTFAGALIPLILGKLDIDPAIAGGVILTTLTDAIGFFTFLGMATLFII